VLWSCLLCEGVGVSLTSGVEFFDVVWDVGYLVYV